MASGEGFRNATWTPTQSVSNGIESSAAMSSALLAPVRSPRDTDDLVIRLI